jgi:hypothetical protein
MQFQAKSVNLIATMLQRYFSFSPSRKAGGRDPAEGGAGDRPGCY